MDESTRKTIGFYDANAAGMGSAPVPAAFGLGQWVRTCSRFVASKQINTNRCDFPESKTSLYLPHLPYICIIWL